MSTLEKLLEIHLMNIDGGRYAFRTRIECDLREAVVRNMAAKLQWPIHIRYDITGLTHLPFHAVKLKTSQWG